MTAENSHASLIHRFYEQCLNQYDSSILPEIFTPDAIAHSGTGDAHGLEAIRRTVDSVHALFPEHRFTVEDVVVNGEKGAARWSMTAINSSPIAGIPPTGRPITNRAVVFYRFADQKIAELWLQVDQIGVLRQIGVPLPGGPAVVPQAAHQ